jgi:PAS domain S-box-containing protein
VVLLACLTGVLCYLAARLGGVLTPRPLLVSPLWLGNVLLTAVLLLVRRRTWPAFLVAGLSGFVFYDVQAGESIRSVVSFLLSNAVEVLIAAWCLSSSFDGVPRLNSLRALAKYSFYAVFLAPFVGAFLGALANGSLYWPSWKIAFLSEAIGFLALMPAILGWVREIHTWSEKRPGYYAEAAALVVALVVLGYLVFDSPEKRDSPALLYSLVPLLLWATLRFGSTGVSSSMIAIVFVSIWGAVHGRGPFTGPGQVIQVLSLQLFLFFAAAPFMVLAAVVEERKHTEEKLKAGEEHSRRLVQGSSVAMIVSRGLEEKVELMNDRFTALFGYTMDDVPDAACWWPLAYPDEAYRQAVRTEWQARVGKAIRNGTDIEPMEVTVRCKDGSTRYVEAHLSCMGETNLVTLVDLTERKLAEESLADVGRKLIEAQEQERTWIARELHDDINQRMALLAIELDKSNQELPPSAVEFHDHMHHAGQHLLDIAHDIQALSHRLHSSKLEYLGFVAAAKSFCEELSEQRKVEIDLSHTAIPRSVPKEISLCLFRVLQEALQNGVKHSGVQHFKVELHGTEAEIQLTVSDLGVGFNPQDAIYRRGLGLISMRERMQLVRGEISIKSQPGSGTTIHARVPFNSSGDSVRAGG